jgi:hypothetical protein
MAPKKETRPPNKRDISAKAGKYVTPEYAKKHPGTTVRETINPKKKG